MNAKVQAYAIQLLAMPEPAMTAEGRAALLVVVATIKRELGK